MEDTNSGAVADTVNIADTQAPFTPNIATRRCTQETIFPQSADSDKTSIRDEQIAPSRVNDTESRGGKHIVLITGRREEARTESSRATHPLYR